MWQVKTVRIRLYNPDALSGAAERLPYDTKTPGDNEPNQEAEARHLRETVWLS